MYTKRYSDVLYSYAAYGMPMIYLKLCKDIYDLPYNDTMKLEIFNINFQFNITDERVSNNKR